MTHKKPIWYISGPMTGIDELNFPAFRWAAEKMRREGFDVVSPHEVCTDEGLSWSEYLRRDIAELIKCDGLALLPGWMHSRGALLEKHIAEQLGMPVRMVSDLLAKK